MKQSYKNGIKGLVCAFALAVGAEGIYNATSKNLWEGAELGGMGLIALGLAAEFGVSAAKSRPLNRTRLNAAYSGIWLNFAETDLHSLVTHTNTSSTSLTVGATVVSAACATLYGLTAVKMRKIEKIAAANQQQEQARASSSPPKV